MSFNEEKKSCSVCHAYLFDEDDTVYCPECGAPHHRDCYDKIGHCALEEFHGTEKQYDIVREKERAEKGTKTDDKSAESTFKSRREQFKDSVECNNCGNTFPAIMNRCPKCGAFKSESQFKNDMPPVMFPQFDSLGGVPKDMDLGKGVTADQARRFVFANTHRYIPKFAAMSTGTKTSWNWLAFLFPSAWYMSRKMYLKGIFSCILLVAFSLLTLPLLSEVAVLDTSAAANYFEYSKILSEHMSSLGALPLLLSFIGSVLNIITRIIIGLFADYHYRNHVIDTIAEIKTSNLDEQEAFMKKGGTSFFGMMLGFFALQYLPSLIAMFI
ncbi:MAG: DUF2628 domain-containing protein [Ruminococcaceae bacterium]|nr:DUF2628 domain-containing protein [Oscillospiraceae bacterium]